MIVSLNGEVGVVERWTEQIYHYTKPMMFVILNGEDGVVEHWTDEQKMFHHTQSMFLVILNGVLGPILILYWGLLLFLTPVPSFVLILYA